MTAAAQFHGFFDDAAIFPPGLAPLDRAVRDHLGLHSPLIGPLILPLAKLPEASGYAAGELLDVSVVLTHAELGELGRSTRPLANLRVVSVEVKFAGEPPAQETWMGQLAELRRAQPGITVYQELPATLVTGETLNGLKDLGVALKFRTGGITPDLFPSPEELIGVLDTAVAVGLPFKLTAGLHRAVRYTDEVTGFRHFGFFNIAAATEALRRGQGAEAALGALMSEDGAGLVTGLGVGNDWRHNFRSIGTCSISEPLETLADIGVFPGPDPRTHQHKETP